jgi:hypothetical protein
VTAFDDFINKKLPTSQDKKQLNDLALSTPNGGDILLGRNANQAGPLESGTVPIAKLPRERQTIDASSISQALDQEAVLSTLRADEQIRKTAKLHASDERQQEDDTSMVKYGDQADDTEGV